MIKNIKINILTFKLGYAAICTLLYSYGFWLDFFALEQSPHANFVISASILFVGLFLYYTFFAIFSFNIKVFKGVVIASLVLNSVFSYYIATYNVYIDQGMMANVFNTDPKEAADLFSLWMVFYVLTLGILPSIFVAKINIIKIKGKINYSIARFLRILTLFLLAIIVLAFSFREVITFGRANKNMFYKQLPYAYVKSTLAYIRRDIRDKIFKPTNFSFEISKPLSSTKVKPKVMVLVVGETARRDNFSLFGYSKKTNPLIERDSVFAFSNVVSCGTSTNVSVPCMFYPLGQDEYQNNKMKIESYITSLSRLKNLDIIWFENNFGGCYENCDKVKRFYLQNEKNPKYCSEGQCTDGVFLDFLDTQLKNIKQDTLIVFHANGSHGPLYYKRYEQSFDKFTPSCKTNRPQDCTKQELINAYDNTILYTDYILHSIIAKLQGGEDKFTSMMLYASDHGESLGEFGLYLHGVPYSIAPKYQKQIPAIAWLSGGALKTYNKACITKRTANPYNHDIMINTSLSFLGIKSQYHKQNSSLIEGCAV